jgi:muramoyltetrapeptide carboxypeptidase
VHGDRIRIGVTAPGSRIDSVIADRVADLAARLYPDRAPEIFYHPQCFLSSGHFAGDDGARAAAFLDIANDDSFDALWFARGGYGACRIAEDVMTGLTNRARAKLYLGYSDAGSLLAGLYAQGFKGLAHGPMPSDILRAGGENAIQRALAYLVDRSRGALESSVHCGGVSVWVVGERPHAPLERYRCGILGGG